MALLKSHIKADNLISHMTAVEAAMRAYARRFGEDEDKWALAGLLHDIDYEECPQLETHSLKAAEMLAAAGLPGDLCHAVKAHNEHHGVPREDLLSRALFAVDELTGFIVAVALVRPSRKLADVEPKSVKKKMKDKSFAAAVNREQLVTSAEELGVDFTEHVTIVLDAMKAIAGELGL